MIAKHSAMTDWSVGAIPRAPRHTVPPKAHSLDELRKARVVREVPRQAAPLTAVRSTLVASSLQVLRERSLFEAYQGHLPKRFHDSVLWTLSPTWLPLDVAVAHYRAIDELGLAPDEAFDMGSAVGEYLHGAFLATLLRGARAAGFTPWTMVGKAERVWDRVFHGGAFGVSMMGPREGLAHFRAFPLLEIPYFRAAFCGVVRAAVGSMTTRCYVREVHPTTTATRPDEADLLVSWA